MTTGAEPNAEKSLWDEFAEDAAKPYETAPEAAPAPDIDDMLLPPPEVYEWKSAVSISDLLMRLNFEEQERLLRRYVDTRMTSISSLGLNSLYTTKL